VKKKKKRWHSNNIACNYNHMKQITHITSKFSDE
jgi:hypothetical protein